MFATERISERDILVTWGGCLFTKEEIDKGLAKPGSIARVSESEYLAARVDDPESDDDYMNHSCDPNTWMLDAITIVARRDVEPGEEITIDYAMFSTGSGWRFEKCECGTGLCRRTVGGNDWKLSEIQDRYGDHFSPYILARIKRLHDQGT